MSEFSESYHLFTSEPQQAIELIKASGLRGFVCAPENGWTSFVVEQGEFKPDSRITCENKLCLLHYVNAEDHGWSFELFEGPSSVCRYSCDWDDDVRSDVSGFKVSEIARLLGKEIADRLAAIVPQLTPQTIDEVFEHETAYDFAQALALPNYEWFSYDGVARCIGKKEAGYPGNIEVPARKP